MERYTQDLANFARPTEPLDNVFTLMRVNAVSTYADVSPGTELSITVATYTNQDQTLPRWQQGLQLTIEDAAPLDTLIKPVRQNMMPVESRYPWSVSMRYGHMPATRAFMGTVALRGEAISASGVMHPKYSGWIELDVPEAKMRTIADLKAHIGKISALTAEERNDSHQQDGHFWLPGKMTCMPERGFS